MRHLQNFATGHMLRQVLRVWAMAVLACRVWGSEPLSSTLPEDSVLRVWLEELALSVPVEYNRQVREALELYLIRQRQWTERALARAPAYLPMIEEVFAWEGLPREIAYLAFVESGYNWRALSPAGAVGLWQFMGATARLAGLHVSMWIDERLDPYRSTVAAARYLKHLYEEFGDWLMAIAAYNCGPGHVRRALGRVSRDTVTFWDIQRYLPRETQLFVPRFIAAVIIANYYPLLGLRPDTVEVFAVSYVVESWEEVEFTGGGNLVEVAWRLGVDAEYLIELNPAWRFGVLPEGVAYRLRVPCGFAPIYNNGWDSLSQVAVPDSVQELSTRLLPRYVYHRVRRGETLWHIARRYGVSVSALKSWNGLRSYLIHPGQKLIIYIDWRKFYGRGSVG